MKTKIKAVASLCIVLLLGLTYDTVYLIAYIFGGGPAPPRCYKYDY